MAGAATIDQPASAVSPNTETTSLRYSTYPTVQISKAALIPAGGCAARRDCHSRL
jgi:hypothetical protein